MALHLGKLDRNDVPGALAFYREAVREGFGEDQMGEVVHILFMLQDDPAAFRAALAAELAASPPVTG